MTPRVIFLFLAGIISASAQTATKPNIIFILADDLGYGEIGCYGQKQIRTPHLDRFAAEGMKFTQFYAGNTVCAPSRSVLMTGQHMGHTTVRGNAGKGNYAAQTLRADETTVARVLRDAGYATGLIGKWGLGEADSVGAPWKQGFDYFFGFINQTHAHNHYPDFLWRNNEVVKFPNVVKPVGEVPGAGYATTRVSYASDLFFEETRSFVLRNKARPFFLFLALTTPHGNNERSRELGEGNEVPDHTVYADRAWNESQKNHAAMITRMDEGIGAVMKVLREQGLDENTLVMFSSDNGPHREGGPNYRPEFFEASGPHRGIKRDLTDGGIRVPFLARWPGKIRAGAVAEHVGYFGDMMATWGELGGAKFPAGVVLDSISVVPTLLGRGDQRKHPYLYWEFYEQGVSQAMLMDGRWKALRLKTPSAPIALYDLVSDPGEREDVAARQPALVARATELMRTARVDNDYWKLPVAAVK